MYRRPARRCPESLQKEQRRLALSSGDEAALELKSRTLATGAEGEGIEPVVSRGRATHGFVGVPAQNISANYYGVRSLVPRSSFWPPDWRGAKLRGSGAMLSSAKPRL